MKVSEPLELNGITLKNRFFKSAMSETMANSRNQPGRNMSDFIMNGPEVVLA